MSALPTPVTDALMCTPDGDPWLLCQQLERDCMTLVLRLFGEDDNTLSPETLSVMERWRPRAGALLGGESFHDFRDRGDPMEKRDPGSWSDWPNKQDREYVPGMGRR